MRALLGGALVIFSLLLAAAWLVFSAAVYEPPQPADAAVAAPAARVAPGAPAEEGADVVAVQGAVERRVAGGKWERLEPGDRLRVDHSVRTGPASRAELTIGGASRITVADRTELTVREMTTAVQRLRLTRGRIGVAHPPGGGRVLRVESASGEAVAETSGARFSVMSTGVSFAVATETGSVNLAAAGGAVEVNAGEQSVAPGGAAPSAAAPIPVSVLLKVARIGGAQETCTVRGTAGSAAVVEVEGEPVETAADGRFAATVRRRRGAPVTVVARDVTGRATERQVRCDDDDGPSKVRLRWTDG
jgi:hypothetical protein